MPRTAPEVTGTPDYTMVSWRFIDANGQPASLPLVTTAALATAAHIEAITEQLGNMTNANLYAVDVTGVYSDAGTPAGAVEEPRESAKDVINYLWKNPGTRATQDVIIPAPLDSLFIEDTNDVDPSNAAFATLATALNAFLEAAYIPISLRFTERKKQNKRTKV